MTEVPSGDPTTLKLPSIKRKLASYDTNKVGGGMIETATALLSEAERGNIFVFVVGLSICPAALEITMTKLMQNIACSKTANRLITSKLRRTDVNGSSIRSH